jgi:hypothetical protein
LARFEFISGTILFCFSFIFVSFGESCFLVCGVQVIGVAWRAVTRIVVGVGGLVQRTRDGRTGQVLGGWAIERSGGIVRGLHRACGDEECKILG